MQRYSKKREAILECLRSTDSHPTADWIYSQLVQVYPDLSLATVYRNLNQLKEAGYIRSVGVVDGNERFDAKVYPHSHAVCRSCGKVLDIEDIQVARNLVDLAEKETGFTISEASLQFTGYCEECRKALAQAGE